MSFKERILNVFKKDHDQQPSWPEDNLSAEQQNAKSEQFHSRYENSSDDQERFDICKAAADEGVIEALYLLGLMYEKGDGKQQYFEQAAECYWRAARYRHVEARFNLGLLHAQGLIGEANYVLSYQCFEESAKQGLAAAQFNLACQLDQGLGCFEDKSLAFEWYLKAAEQGFVQAWNNVAVCYYKGEGTDKDLIKAYAWTLLAAKKGVAEAKQAEPNMTTELDSNQILEGKALLDKLWEKYGDQ